MKVIGVAGFARAGKDTFVTIAKNIFAANGITAVQYSFANTLKKEVEPFLRDTCGCDVWTQDTEVKKDMRDFLVWYGTTWWRKRDPKRWIRHVDLALKADKPQVALISDVRYPNEGEWVHAWEGYLVHVEAFKWEPRIPTSSFDDVYPDEPLVKHYFDAPNEQEKLNDPIVMKMSDYKLEWEAKGLSPKEAVENRELQREVLTALNSCSGLSVPLRL